MKGFLTALVATAALVAGTAGAQARPYYHHHYYRHHYYHHHFFHHPYFHPHH